MTMKKYVSLSLAAFVLGFSLIGVEAHAQLLNANGTAGANTNITDTIDADVDVSADTAVDADTSSADEEASSDATVVADFSFTRDDLDQNTEYGVRDVDSIRSSAGLESYVAASVRDNERLESVAITDGRMDMRYRKDAKFLWVVPSSMTVDVEIANDGDVMVRYPWYSFLMASGESRADLEARLETEIVSISNSIAAREQAELSETATTGIKTDGADLRRWAHVLDRVYAALSVSGSVEG